MISYTKTREVDTMSHYDYLIVGSGLFGATFAYEAKLQGKRCLVLEKRPAPGGNIRCEERDGIRIHTYGAHIFHTSDPEVWDFVNRFAQFNNYINSPVANYHGELYNLPFNMNTFYKMWGTTTPHEAIAKIERQREEFTGKTPKNLEEQAISLVGRDIYEKLIKGYTEKQWGKSCAELPPSIIKRIPVRFIYDNNYFNDPYQGIPKGGYNRIIDALLDGIDIVCDNDFHTDRKRWSNLATKTLYTGTLDSLFDYRLGHLQYRSVRFEHQRLEQTNYQGVAVMNYTDRDTPYTRIIEHKHFEFGSQPVTWISKEYPVDYAETGEPYYPIGDDANVALHRQYLEFAAEDKSLLLGGRLAEYRYYDMDKTIRSALDLSKREFGTSSIER